MGMTPEQARAWELRQQGKSIQQIADTESISYNTAKCRLQRAKQWAGKSVTLEDSGYDLSATECTDKDAWDSHSSVLEREVAKRLNARWKTIKRDGPFCIFHSTDEHIDDNKSALKVLEADISAAHDLGSIMVHGGDALNNWPVAGRLAKQWAEQSCTLPDALKRLRYFVEIFKPDVWIDGNHEEMNPYLTHFIDELLPDGIVRDYWCAKFNVETPHRIARCAVSHKFQKGSSWFHKLHGHIRETLEGEAVDLLMDGHLHSDGVLDQTLPERDHATLCVASAGYKVMDDWATRISRGAIKPKLRGRAHWIVCDDQAEDDCSMFAAFKSPLQAEAYLSGLSNLRAV